MILAERVELVLTEMRRAGIAVLVGLSGDMHPFQEADPVALLADVRVVGEALVMLDAGGSRTLVVSPAWEAERACERSGIAATMGCDDLGAHIARLLPGKGRVGIAGLGGVSHRTAARLAAELPDRMVPFDEELNRATRRKTAEEIGRACRATAIAEQGYEVMLRVAAIGMSEVDLATEVCTAMTALGADDNFIMLSASPHNRAVRPPGSHRLESGDIILCEISPSFEGQFSQICRTAVVGDVPVAFVEKYALLQASVRNGTTAARTGATVGAVVEAINANLIAAGYGEYCVPPHMRARGHGLGFGSVAPGDLSAQSNVVLERDMVLVIHPNQYMPETGYMMCGEPVVVTDRGARQISSRTATLDRVRGAD